jgi:hypothetical protein
LKSFDAYIAAAADSIDAVIVFASEKNFRNKLYRVVEVFFFI